MEKDNELLVCTFCDKAASTLRGLSSFTPIALSSLSWCNFLITDLRYSSSVTSRVPTSNS